MHKLGNKLCSPARRKLSCAYLLNAQWNAAKTTKRWRSFYSDEKKQGSNKATKQLEPVTGWTRWSVSFYDELKLKVFALKSFPFTVNSAEAPRHEGFWEITTEPGKDCDVCIRPQTQRKALRTESFIKTSCQDYSIILKWCWTVLGLNTSFSSIAGYVTCLHPK